MACQPTTNEMEGTARDETARSAAHVVAPHLVGVLMNRDGRQAGVGGYATRRDTTNG
jgi:hypothetical protein